MADKLKKVLTKSEFARDQKVSRARVSQWAKAGLPVRGDGRLDYSAALAWVKEHRAPQRGGWLVRKPAAKHAPVDTETDQAAYITARGRREQAEAKLAELRLGRETGALLAREDVERAVTRIGGIYAAGRKTVPAQLAARLVGKTDLGEIQRIIATALKEADTAICDEIEARFPELAQPPVESEHAGTD